MFTPSFVHDLVHRVGGLDYPHSHWWMDLVAVLAFVVAPAWTAWLAARLVLRRARLRRRSRAQASRRDAPSSPDPQPSPVDEDVSHGCRLEAYVVQATLRFQLRLVLLSLLTLPAAWLLLEIPKHIINHALADTDGDGHPGMAFLGLGLGRVELLFALCASYLGVLTLGGLAKYAVNQARGRVNERLVRRLRLAIVRRARGEQSPEQRATLAAVAVQEVEPIGYFGGSLVVVPLVQGGTLVTSVVFLLFQNAALALAALIMLPVQLSILPSLQRRLNARVRERVHGTRALGGLLTAARTDHAAEPGEAPDGQGRRLPPLLRQIGQAKDLERVRVEINDLKGRMKGLYNYTSNLTPFFFFSLGGYLVVQGRLSLGALVAALAAYKEIAPALRELFDFAQSWSDASARFEEVTKALARAGHPSERGAPAPGRQVQAA
ncbi:multidrug ABC transporter ATPase [Methylobacterium durans]|uniref:Multidrug ABC transporter ATPase n=1 Tax=Methylobacterium durans TaxID=2202825 RepID=A0A2U8WB60_9HYPH|nr:multidrug ABC transporter ATPase [Methylobacterium durans]AWN42546.1 multidrug ABC transporter ATPase [Methylobacterium durans]